MIILRLTCGLGTQLFQYAAGRALALRNGVELGLDTKCYLTKQKQKYELASFNIRVALLPARVMKLLDGSLSSRIANRLASDRVVPLDEGQGKGPIPYNPTIWLARDWSYLRGYFQTGRYFIDAKERICEELSLAKPLKPKNSELLTAISETLAISIHIQRGDYLTHPFAKVALGALDLDYYHRAADYIAAHVDGEPTFYVFSDEPEWAMCHLRLPFRTQFLDESGSSQPADHLHLTAACQHHILANSTFSWWGAWLNKSPRKIVVAPARWYIDAQANDTNAALLPNSWIRV